MDVYTNRWRHIGWGRIVSLHGRRPRLLFHMCTWIHRTSFRHSRDLTIRKPPTRSSKIAPLIEGRN